MLSVDPGEFDTTYDPAPPPATPRPMLDLPDTPAVRPEAFMPTPVKHIYEAAEADLWLLDDSRPVIIKPCQGMMRSWYCPIEQLPSYAEHH